MTLQLNKIKPYLLLCALFLMAQSAAQLHDMDHLLHGDDPSCMAFHSVQNHHGALFSHSFSIPVAQLSASYLTDPGYRVDIIRQHFVASRAPPSVC